MATKKAEEGRKTEEEKGPQASVIVASPPPPPPPPPPAAVAQSPPPLPRTAKAETLAEASGVPSVVRFALWSLENAKGDDYGGKSSSLSSSSSSSSSSPPRLLSLLPANKQSQLRLLAVAHAAMLEAGRCWPQKLGGEIETIEGDWKKLYFARGLSPPRDFLALLSFLSSAYSSSSPSSSFLSPLTYFTLQGAAGRENVMPMPPLASLRVDSLCEATARVSAGVFLRASDSASSSRASSPSSFPAAFAVTVNLSEHFDATSGDLRDPRGLWRTLCDGIASPLAAAAADSRGLPQLEASLLGLPEDLLLEVLLIVARGYEPRREGDKGEGRSRALQGPPGRGQYD